MSEHTRCHRLDQIKVAGRDEYRYRCPDCGHVYTAIEARRLSGPLRIGYANTEPRKKP